MVWEEKKLLNPLLDLIYFCEYTNILHCFLNNKITVHHEPEPLLRKQNTDIKKRKFLLHSNRNLNLRKAFMM